MKKEIGIFVLLACLCTLTAAQNRQFISATNLTNMADADVGATSSFRFSGIAFI